jgi:hypothetical protein
LRDDVADPTRIKTKFGPRWMTGPVADNTSLPAAFDSVKAAGIATALIVREVDAHLHHFFALYTPSFPSDAANLCHRPFRLY